MTVTQLYFATGLTTFGVVLNMVVGILQMNSMRAHLTRMEANMNARFDSIENRFMSLERRSDVLYREGR